jgi:AraC-like DNA-binding protein
MLCGMGAEAGSASRTAAGAPRAFRTGDLDHARAETSRLYYPLRIEALSADGSFGLEMATVSLGALTLGRLAYATDIRKDCGDLRTAYHVNVPLSGRVASACGDQEVLATPRVAAVFNPSGRTVLDRWTGGSTQLCLKIGRDMLETELAERIGRPAREPLRFRLAMDMTAPGNQSWRHAVAMLAGELDNPGGLATQALLAAEIQHLIVTGLLWGQPSNYSGALRTPGRAPRPRAVKIAIDLIEATPEHPWTITELARAAGISVRALEDGFQRYVGTSPRRYLRNCRLDRVHDELLAAAPGETAVGRVAITWGFAHLGRFAQAYRQRFGASPSDTLRVSQT